MQNKPLSFSVDIRLNQRRNLLNFDYKTKNPEDTSALPKIEVNVNQLA